MWEITPWKLFLLGGPVMWPILLCSIFAMAVIIERLWFFYAIREDSVALKNRIFGAVSRNDIKAAMTVCDLSGSPAAKVLKIGLLEYGRSRQEVQSAMEDASQFEVYLLQERLPALFAVGNAALLLGFLGTITGMCGLLHAVSVRAQAMNQLLPAGLFGGLWEALLTTAAGMIVGILCGLAYHYLVFLQTRYVAGMEKIAVELAHFLDHVTEPAPTPAGEDS